MLKLAPACAVALGLVLAAPVVSAQPKGWVAKARAKHAESRQKDRARWSALRLRVAAATVMLPERGCAGVVVRNGREVATAAHCIVEGALDVSVDLPSGAHTTARLGYLDRDADLALLSLDVPAPLPALSLADALPRRGTPLLFVGRTDRAANVQITRVERLDRCPSLPLLPYAVFTTLAAKPGDSGSPLVDDKGRVVALVHGGARCEIAVPTAALSRVKVAPLPPRPSVPDVTPPAPNPDEDSLQIHKTDDGFRFHWSFKWHSGD